MDLLGNLVDALHDAGPQANPGCCHRFQQAARRCAQGGILPDPNLNPDLDLDDDDTLQVKIPLPFLRDSQEKDPILTSMQLKIGWKQCASEKTNILTNSSTL